MIKLIASDIDGTLVPESTADLDPQFYDTVRKLKEQGVYFAAASGRQYGSIYNLLEPVADDIFFISGNGTNIFEKGKRIHQVSMNRKDAEEAVRYMRTLKDCILTVSTWDCIYLEHCDEAFEKMQREGYRNVFQIVPDVLKEPIEIQKMAIYRRAGAAPLVEEVTALWKDRFRVIQAGACWIDLVDYQADKGNALSWLQEKLQISREETMAFGDNINDLGMFAAAKESYAVESASEEVKGAARHLALPCEKSGVLRVMKTVLDQK